MRTLIAILLILPTLTWAQSVTTITGDFTGDGIPDRAELSAPDDLGMAGLELYAGLLGDGQALATTAPALIWVGGIGQQPQLSITTKGALQVVSTNEAIGRNRWHQTLTIAYRDYRFILVGFAYSWYDTIDLANQGNCMINLPTGQGLLTKGEAEAETTFQRPPTLLPIENWQPNIPEECGVN